MINKTSDSQKVDFAFTVTNSSKHSGGATSLNRLYSKLIDQNLSVAIIYTFNETVEIFRDGCSLCIQPLLSINLDPQTVVVDFWTSACYFNVFPASRKVLFVQDRDYFFYPQGDCSLVIKNLFGDRSILKVTLGDWIPQSSTFLNSKSLPFACHYNIPNTGHSDLSGDIHIAAFFKFEPKRLPFYLLENLKSLDGVNRPIKIHIFGDSNVFLRLKYPTFNWHGFLNYQDMMNLLARCQIGICCSESNISLLPYEMMSKGMIVIQNKGDVTSHFFGDPSFMFDPVSMNLASVINGLLSLDAEELSEKLSKFYVCSKSKVSNWDIISEAFLNLITTDELSVDQISR